jgi:parvulin-like peptidyl-prolyl isomerase
MLTRLRLAAVVALAPALVLAAKGSEKSAPAVAQASPAQKAAPSSAPAAPAPSDATSGETTYAYLTRDGGTFKAPLFAAESENLPVALIEDEAISLRELMKAIAGVHGAAAAGKQAGRKDFSPVLDRLIDARLLAREARQMGIAELPEVQQSLASSRENIGREILQERVLKDVKPDAMEVDQAYRQAARQWKVRSVLVPRQDDAKAFEAQLKAGKKFEAIAKQLVAAKKAKGGEEPMLVGRANGLPEVVGVLEKTKVGAVSAPLKLKDGYALMKVEAITYPEDPKAREEAVQASLGRQRKAVLRKYYDSLVKRYAKLDEGLLKRLDFEAAKPGLAALEKDQRVLARIEGAKPITVAELAAALKQGFYHGVEGAIKEKRVNREKPSVFDGLLSARIVPVEVKHLGIDGSEEFKDRLADTENSILFSKFVEKAVLPELKITDEKLKAYYAEHKKEYAYPTFYKVESLAFTSLKGAEGAIKQLRAGTDFKWLVTNADGQVRASERKLGLEGTLAATALPKDLATLLSGSKKGDHRLYADDANKQYYAVHVLDVIGATDQPFETVKDQIQQKVFAESLTAAVKGWADKLRKASQVRVLLTRIGS